MYSLCLVPLWHFPQ